MTSEDQTAVPFSQDNWNSNPDSEKKTLPPDFIQQPKQDLIQGAGQELHIPRTRG